MKKKDKKNDMVILLISPLIRSLDYIETHFGEDHSENHGKSRVKEHIGYTVIF